MIVLESQFRDRPVVSLQTGQPIAWVNALLLTPSSLTIIGFICYSAIGAPAKLLMIRDVRQFTSDCLIIDDEDSLTDPADIVRLRSSLKNPYSPLDKKVVSDSGHRLGTVEDFGINFETYRVQKLHVRRPFPRNWFNPSLIIDRSQIVDITPDRIVVRDAVAPADLVTNPIPKPLPETQS
jgi:uncharacterized protein YrrD